MLFAELEAYLFIVWCQKMLSRGFRCN